MGGMSKGGWTKTEGEMWGRESSVACSTGEMGGMSESGWAKTGGEMWGGRSTATCSIGEMGGKSESGWTKTGGEMLKNVNGQFALSPAVCCILLVIIQWNALYIETNSQHLLEGVLMQSPSDNVPVKEYQIAKEGNFAGGNSG